MAAIYIYIQYCNIWHTLSKQFDNSRHSSGDVADPSPRDTATCTLSASHTSPHPLCVTHIYVYKHSASSHTMLYVGLAQARRQLASY